MKERQPPTLGRDIRNKIGQLLRCHYDTVIPPMPERMVELIRQLEAMERAPRKAA